MAMRVLGDTGVEITIRDDDSVKHVVLISDRQAEQAAKLLSDVLQEPPTES